jgi:DNA-binding response OmpR family regulator
MEQQEEQKQEVNIIKRALLVEDYEACQRFMSVFLQNLGYQVDLVDDSFTAIKNIQSKTYDLILEDINLHGCKSGKKIIQLIRKNKENIGTPIIVWSAYVNKSDEEEYLAWGADAALKKNCGIEGLKNAIEKCHLTSRYERKFRFQLIGLIEKWKHFLKEASRLKGIQFIWNLEFILHEAITILKEYNQWLDFHSKGEKNPS